MTDKPDSPSEPTTLSGQIEIPSRDLITIFKLGDTSAYETSLSNEDSEGVYGNMMTIFDFLNSPTSQVLSRFDDLKEYTAHISYSEKGLLTMFVVLQTANSNAELEKWAFFTIAQAAYKNPEKEEDYTLKPLFALSGRLENEVTFHPEDCVCRISVGGNLAHLRAETDDDFYAMLMYGDAAFTAMRENKEADIAAFAKHVQPNLIPTAHIFYDELRHGILSRTPPQTSPHKAKFADAAAPTTTNTLTPEDEKGLPTLEQQEITLRLSALRNIFLIGDKTLYPQLSADQVVETSNSTSNALAFSEAPFAEDFFGARTLDLSTAKIYSSTSPTGTFINIIQYQGISSIEEEDSRIVIVIGENPPPDAPSAAPTPYFTLCAKIFGNDVAIEDCRCLKITAPQTYEEIVATTEHDFYRAINYADSAFTGLAGDLPTNIEDYGRWLNDDDESLDALAKSRYDELKSRTAHSFSVDIMESTTLLMQTTLPDDYDIGEDTIISSGGSVPTPHIH